MVKDLKKVVKDLKKVVKDQTPCAGNSEGGGGGGSERQTGNLFRLVSMAIKKN